MSTLFGGGVDKEAQRRARQAQQVANDRQLAELNRNEQANDLTRKRPRGRRLFSDAADTSTGPNGITVQKNLS